MTPTQARQVLSKIDSAYSRGRISFDRLKRSYKVVNRQLRKSEDTNNE